MAEGVLHIPVRLARLPKEGHRIALEVSGEDRQALAASYELLSLKVMHVTLHVMEVPKGAELKGRIRADVTQECVVTTQPVENSIESEFTVRFIRAPRVDGEEIEFSALDDEEEPYPGDDTDVGPLVEEYFSLALDPYPRVEGARFEMDASGEELSPFAQLASLAHKKARKDD